MRKLLPFLGALAVLAAPRPAAALFHFSHISEVMTSWDGDPNVQFVEITMEAGSQNFTTNSVLGAFNAAGVYQGDVLVVPGDLANDGNGVRWLMGTTEFETAAGVQADFEFEPGLITESGMICWGAPGVAPPAPGTWDHTVPSNYVDCVAYGTYTGATHPGSGNPTPLSPDGHSLRRVSDEDDNAIDFACGDPADPTNNAPASGTLAATDPCPVAPATLTKGQVKCVDKLHGASNGVTKAEDALAKSCVAAFQKGKSTSAIACLATDPGGKLQKARAKVTAAESKSCVAPNQPPFGNNGGAEWTSGGENASERGLIDLFDGVVKKGGLDEGLVTKAANAAGAKCQATAIAQLARMTEGFQKTSQRLHKAILSGKSGPAPTTAEELKTALDAAYAADAKYLKLRTQVGAAVAKQCPTFAGLFGTDCAAAATPAELGECVARLGTCSACLGVSSGNAIPLACDAIGGVDCLPLE
jgi:hypothetical protein